MTHDNIRNHPNLKWAQRKHMAQIIIDLADISNEKIGLTADGHLKFLSETYEKWLSYDWYGDYGNDYGSTSRGDEYHEKQKILDDLKGKYGVTYAYPLKNE